MPGSCLPSPSGLPKRRRYRRKFKKQVVELAAAAAAIPGGLGSSSTALGFLFAVGLVGFSKSAAAASPPGGNLVRNCVEFCDLG